LARPETESPGEAALGEAKPDEAGSDEGDSEDCGATGLSPFLPDLFFPRLFMAGHGTCCQQLDTAVTLTRVLITGLLHATIYSVVGVLLLLLGFVVVDLLTPGALRHQIWTERNRNASIYLSSSLLGTGAIVFTAILTTYADLVQGLFSTISFGLLGLVLKAAAFWLVDMLTPGKLGEMVVDTKIHPAVWVSASANLAISAIVCASIS
jgi:uncharacterized membrane protein YjfL (UPF0719 family)